MKRRMMKMKMRMMRMMMKMMRMMRIPNSTLPLQTPFGKLQ